MDSGALNASRQEDPNCAYTVRVRIENDLVDFARSDMGTDEVRAFLLHLAVSCQMAASTHHGRYLSRSNAP